MGINNIFNQKTAIQELKRIKDLHFANPDKKEVLRKIAFSESKQFKTFVRILLGMK